MPDPHELAAPQPTQHKLELNDVVHIAPGGPNADLPTIMGEQPIAQIDVGGGRPENTETLYLIKVGDTAQGDYRALAARAEAVGAETSDYLLAAIHEGDNHRPHVGGMAFLPSNRPDTIIGREPGNVAWFDFGGDRAVDPRQWTPFESSRAVSRKQFDVTVSDSDDGIYIRGLTERAETDITASNMKVVHSAAAKRAQEAAERAANVPRRYNAGRLLARRTLRR